MAHDESGVVRIRVKWVDKQCEYTLFKVNLGKLCVNNSSQCTFACFRSRLALLLNIIEPDSNSILLLLLACAVHPNPPFCIAVYFEALFKPLSTYISFHLPALATFSSLLFFFVSSLASPPLTYFPFPTSLPDPSYSIMSSVGPFISNTRRFLFIHVNVRHFHKVAKRLPTLLRTHLRRRSLKNNDAFRGRIHLSHYY